METTQFRGRPLDCLLLPHSSEEPPLSLFCLWLFLNYDLVLHIPPAVVCATRGGARRCSEGGKFSPLKYALVRRLFLPFLWKKKKIKNTTSHYSSLSWSPTRIVQRRNSSESIWPLHIDRWIGLSIIIIGAARPVARRGGCLSSPQQQLFAANSPCREYPMTHIESPINSQPPTRPLSTSVLPPFVITTVPPVPLEISRPT